MKSIVLLPVLAALAAAIPHAKRDVVWVTATNVVTVVQEETKTIWINADGTTSTPSAEPVANAPKQEKHVAPPVVQANPHSHANHHQAQNQHAPVENVKPAPVPAPTSSPAPAPVEPEPVTSTTSVYYAPAATTPATTQAAPQTTAAPAPQVQTSAPAPVPQSYSPPAQPAYSPPQSGSGSGSSSGGNCADQSGTCTSAKFTYYTPGMGSCGQTNSDSDYVFAYGKDLMAAKGGANPNLNPLCGRKIQIKAHDGSMVTAKLVDTCYACGSQDGMLDLSTDLWNRVAGDSGADGVMNGMEFTWM